MRTAAGPDLLVGRRPLDQPCCGVLEHLGGHLGWHRSFGITGVRLSTAERRRYFTLARTLGERFSMEELEELLFGMGINPDNLEGVTLAAKARELVKYCLRRDSIGELLDTGKGLRQDIDWDSFR